MSTDAEKGRLVAGLWCTDVLAGLPDFVDGELSEAEAAAVRAHLDGCDWCERFGGAYSGVVARLRSDGPAREEAPDITAKLLGRISEG